MNRTQHVLLAPVLGAFVVSLCLPSVATAIMLTVNSTPLTANNTADFTNASTSDKRQNLSTVGVLDAGGSELDFVGATLTAQTRYAAITVADRDSNNGSSSRTATHEYQVSFSVSAPANMVYDLVIDTKRLGALTSGDDSTFGSSEVRIGALTGSYSGPGSPVGSLNLAMQEYALIVELGNRNDAINQSAVMTIAGLVGPQNFTLTFNWGSQAFSNGNTGVLGFQGDEAAVRLGMGTTYGGTNAGTYPGPGSRVAANDGHYVNITATVTSVPEPSSFVLGSLGLLGISLAAWRRRRT